MATRLLILSVAPVPTQSTKVIEGGGMRAWFLAQGLKEHDIEVTVAVPENFATAENHYQGVNLTTWSIGPHLAKFINSFDSVLILYSRGDLTRFVVENIAPSVQLIVDLYVPIYVEVSARNPEVSEAEVINYLRDVQDWNLAFERGDVFLYANPAQKLLYTGVLSALGRLTPQTYFQKLLIYLPLGYERKPVTATDKPFKGRVVAEDDFVLLWFGGLYPWFDIRQLIRSVAQLSKKYPKLKLLILGAKNPFNNHPDFIRQYEEVGQLVEELQVKDKCVFLQDWVPFEERVNWFRSADLVISLNKLGDENQFSWRTRYVDYIWGELPMLTNGGDPVSEILLAHKAAIKIDDANVEAIADSIENVLQNPQVLSDALANLLEFKPQLYVDTLAQELAALVKQGYRAADLGNRAVVLSQSGFASRSEQINHRWVRKFYKLLKLYDVYGLRVMLRKLIKKLLGKS